MLREPATGLVLDLSDGPDPRPLLGQRMDRALAAMAALEAGSIANLDERRMVGHYWLRDPDLAPGPDLGREIRAAWAALEALPAGDRDEVLMIGIGGSALGPQLVADCLSRPSDPRTLHWLDNTDPEGFRHVLTSLEPARTLAVVVSKSGGTVETRNGMLAARARWAEAGVDWASGAVAITGPGSELDALARAEGWAARLPMWDWVGGRTSVTGPVGLAPMALAGWDWRGLLEGAAAMDRATRRQGEENPAAWLAAAWYLAGEGRGDRALVVLPYRDRLRLLSRYLQQLVMESLGKRLDRQGQVVHQGLTVYGNKGSTDQHAYVQQLREGPDDAFVQFVAVLADRDGPGPEVAPGADMGDALLAFLVGTRRALSAAGRRSLTVVLDRLDAHRMGVLLALHERAVALYGLRAGINPFHQPGVEAGKRAARDVLALAARLAAGEPVEGVPEDDVELVRARLAATGRLPG